MAENAMDNWFNKAQLALADLIKHAAETDGATLLVLDYSPEKQLEKISEYLRNAGAKLTDLDPGLKEEEIKGIIGFSIASVNNKIKTASGEGYATTAKAGSNSDGVSGAMSAPTPRAPQNRTQAATEQINRYLDFLERLESERNPKLQETHGLRANASYIEFATDFVESNRGLEKARNAYKRLELYAASRKPWNRPPERYAPEEAVEYINTQLKIAGRSLNELEPEKNMSDEEVSKKMDGLVGKVNERKKEQEHNRSRGGR